MHRFGTSSLQEQKHVHEHKDGLSAPERSYSVVGARGCRLPRDGREALHIRGEQPSENEGRPAAKSPLPTHSTSMCVCVCVRSVIAAYAHMPRMYTHCTQ